MNIPQSIENMLKTLHDAGYAAYLVGGCVRDALLGLVPHDYDIATNAVPDEIIGLFGKKHCTFYGRAFGTVGVRQGGFAEITTFRTEGDYRDCRHPGVVKFADHVEEDLARRDFTCNAIAYDPRTGLLDPYHGADDLKNGSLRAVGVPTARFAAHHARDAVCGEIRNEARHADGCGNACVCLSVTADLCGACDDGVMRHAHG